MSVKDRIVLFVGMGIGIGVATSVAVTKAIYDGVSMFMADPLPDGPLWETETWEQTLVKVPPETWRCGDTVRHRKTGEEVTIWGLSTDNLNFVAEGSESTVRSVTNYILVALKEVEKES